MKTFSYLFPRLIILAVFILLIATFHVPAQSIEPDPEMIRQMTAYARKHAESADPSRPRVVRKLSSPNDYEKELGEESEIAREMARKAFDWINEKRAANGLSPLKWNDKMAKVARYHSQNMARDNYFSHQELDGSMINDRADMFGFSDWTSIGENIAFNRGFKLPAESACQQWMNSPSHRDNILDKRWKESAIGVAVAKDGSYYFTQVFLLK